VGAILVVGVIAAVVVLSNRGSNIGTASGTARLATVSAPQLSRLLLTTSDPRPGSSHKHAAAAHCSALGHTGLRNPWSCHVRYPRSPRFPKPLSVDYRIVVTQDGSISGIAPGGLTVTGCCIRPGASS
jgi:hypothetical protein